MSRSSVSAGRVLVEPRELAGVDVERQRRAGEQRVVLDRHAAADRHPRLRLRRAPERQVQHGIVAAGDPRLAARAEQRGQRAPRVASLLALRCHGVESPQLFAGRRVVRADEALLLAIRLTAAESLDDLALRDERAAARAVVAFRAIADRGVPHGLAGSRVERHQVRVARRQEDLVVIQRDAAHRGAVRVGAVAVLPNQFAGLPVERLQDVARVVEEDDAVVNDRRRLIGAAFVHRPDPFQLQILHVVGGDLVQRAEIRRVVIAADHQPVGRIRIAQHRLGDRDEVLHFAVDRDADWRRGAATAAAASRRLSRRCGAATAGLRRRRRRLSRRDAC